MRWLRLCRTVRSPSFADLGDGPAVAVLDPVGGGEAQSAVVGAGDDHVSDAGLVSVGQAHLAMPAGECVETMCAGSAVEFGDEVAGGGDHDRVESSRSVGNPSREGILRGGGEVADMDAAVIEVEVECLDGSPSRRASDAAASAGSVKRCSSVESEGAVGVFDVAEDAAGADRGELLIITDQPDAPTTSDGELDGGVEGEGVGHPGFVDDHQGRWADPRPPSRAGRRAAGTR